MTYEVEFRIPTAQYAYVNLKISATTAVELKAKVDGLDDRLALILGQTGAALIGAVNHGHANPVEAAEPAVSPEELIKSELGGKVLETRQKAAEDQSGPTAQPASPEPSETPSRPWNKPSQPAQQKPWQVEPHVRDTIPSEDIDDFFS